MAFPSKVTLYKLNDNYIEIDGLSDGLDPTTYFNAATITATLKDSSGNNVTGATNISLSYVASSNGKYRGTVQETFNPSVGSYTLHIDASQGGIVGHWEVPASVKIRKS